MQIKSILTGLLSFLFYCDSQVSEELYILYQPDVTTEKITSTTENGVEYIFKIDLIKDEYSKFKSPIYLQSLARADTLVNLKKLYTHDIKWLNDEYLKSFEYFKNDPPGKSKSGRILSFDLNKPNRDIYILEKYGSKWLKTKVEHFFKEY